MRKDTAASNPRQQKALRKQGFVHSVITGSLVEPRRIELLTS